MSQFLPANKFEADQFLQRFCWNCGNLSFCPVLNDALEGQYPEDWQLDEKGGAVCVEFVQERVPCDKTGDLLGTASRVSSS